MSGNQAPRSAGTQFGRGSEQTPGPARQSAQFADYADEISKIEQAVC